MQREWPAHHAALNYVMVKADEKLASAKAVKDDKAESKAKKAAAKAKVRHRAPLSFACIFGRMHFVACDGRLARCL